MNEEQVFLLDGARTAFGGFGKSLAKLNAVELGLASAAEALRRSKAEPGEIDNVVYGSVIHAHPQAVYTARHIALRAGIPIETPALLVNRLCGSGLQAVITAAQSIRLGESQLALAGGTESMSQAPHADFASRFGGVKLGAIRLEDMLSSALTDSYIGLGMGETAEAIAERYGIGREQQDEYAALSQARAAAAASSGVLGEEIVAVELESRSGTVRFEQDESIRADTTAAKLAALKPAFRQGGTVTAGNASGINDGAASLVLASERALRGRQPLARIVSWAAAGVEPQLMGLGPVPAARLALDRAGLAIGDMDRVEINEAFAVQLLAVEQELGLDRSITNVNGGALAIGHPIGASGARIALSLAYELRRSGKRYGLAALCIGGGQGIALVLERDPAWT